ncbi:MAG: hypothetical protein QNK03_03060, partial [Myxococcota bacterium]|nr:hypothetical protein [Myxococcota bacterium]
MRRAVVLTTAALAVLLLAAPGARAQSAVAQGTAANVWVLDENGETVATYNAVTGQWTEQATQFFDQTLVSYDGGSTLIDFDPDDFGAVMVNQAASSLPPLAGGIPDVSLAGLGPAQADATTPSAPSVSVSPAPGTYDETIEVVLTALPPPQFTPNSLGITWDVDGGEEQSASEPPTASVFLVAEGTYTIHAQAAAIAGFFVYQSPVVTATFTIAGAGPITRDTDGDGVPDVAEVEQGSNPLVADFHLDGDGDGLTDFEERVRGSDPEDPDSLPADSDGDGWSDFDEGVRGTNPNDPPHLVDPADPDRYFPDRPVARRLREVEYVWSGAFRSGDLVLVPRADMGALTVTDPSWTTFFDQRAVPSAERLAELGLLESELPVHQRHGEIDGELAEGRVPPLRTPAGVPNLIQAGHLDADGARDGWTVAAWVDATPDLDPAHVVDFLAEQEQSFTTGAEWMAGYVAYLTANAVRPLAVQVTPRTTAALALLDGLVAWHARLAPEAAILLGDPASDARPVEAVEQLAQALALALFGEPSEDAGRPLGALHAELAAQLGPGGLLEAFDAAAATLFADFD